MYKVFYWKKPMKGANYEYVKEYINKELYDHT